MKFGDILKQLRAEKDIGQSDLANLLNVDRSTIGKWENNSSTPDFHKLMIIANYFDVSTDYLLGRSKTRINMSCEEIQFDDDIINLQRAKSRMPKEDKELLDKHLELLEMNFKKYYDDK